MANMPLTEKEMISRREAILRVSAILGGVALIGGESLLTGCRTDGSVNTDKPFSAEEIAFLDEVADTILPTTSTPGAKAAQTGAFMAMMVRDTYDEKDRKTFRDGIAAIDAASKKANGVGFMQATPQQRQAVLEQLDKDQKAVSDIREANSRNRSLAWLTDQRTEGAGAGTPAQTNPAAGITEDPPKHYFRMMKELTLLGYFTSEIGMTQAQRYMETPGRYDPCVPYTPGEKNWAGHA